ncbi:hypothetical protein AnigIFM59636_009681 [Aspergillus niger]|nr:hypothetical protein AnigIFM59636_009681 [Aspergillus niger]
MKPLPRGSLDPSNANANATSASRTQLTCPVRSTWSGAEERVVAIEPSLHRELDSRIHDSFLEQAGWNPSKGLPESKEQIIQAAIFLIDYMVSIIMSLLRQENKMPRQLSEYLTSQIRCMQLQQLVLSLRKQNQISQQQLRRLQQENQTLVGRIKALELQLINMGTCYGHLRVNL